MFELKICGIETAKNLIGRDEWPDMAVSLLDPKLRQPWFSPTEKHHIEFFHDVDAVFTDDHKYNLPSREAMERILAFTQRIQPTDKVLIHCHAGISRSTATAIVVACQHGLAPEEAIKWVHETRNQMWPNKLIIRHGDDVLGLGGQLVEAHREWVTKEQGGIKGLDPATVTQEHVDEMQRIQNLLKGLW